MEKGGKIVLRIWFPVYPWGLVPCRNDWSANTFRVHTFKIQNPESTLTEPNQTTNQVVHPSIQHFHIYPESPKSVLHSIHSTNRREWTNMLPIFCRYLQWKFALWNQSTKYTDTKHIDRFYAVSNYPYEYEYDSWSRLPTKEYEKYRTAIWKFLCIHYALCILYASYLRTQIQCTMYSSNLSLSLSLSL